MQRNLLQLAWDFKTASLECLTQRCLGRADRHAHIPSLRLSRGVIHPPSSLPSSLPHRLLFARDDAFERVGEEGPTYSIDVVDDNYSTDIYRYNSCHWIFDNMYSEQASVFLEHVQNSLSCNSTFRIEKVNTLWLSVY